MLPSTVLGSLSRGPEGGPPDDWAPLGYTIYRTDYSDGTEAAWLTLVAAIEGELEEEIIRIFGEFIGHAKEGEAIDQICSLIHIDARFRRNSASRPDHG